MLAFLERTLGCGGVIAYHGIRTSNLLPSVHVTPQALRTHIEFLGASYNVVSLKEFVDRRKSGRSLRRCVAITFDDAYTGVASHALPLLEQHRLPATVFVATHFSANNVRFWWDRLEWFMRHASAAERTLVLEHLGLAEGTPDHAIRDHLIVQCRGALPVSLSDYLSNVEQRLGLVPERALLTDELIALARHQFVDFGCHTERHYALPWLADPKAEEEVRASLDWLREHLPRVRPYLAYPYGLYSTRTIESARRAGIEAAFALEGRAATSRFALFSCPRIGMADVNTLRGLRLRLAWATIPLVAAQNGSWHPKLRPTTV